MRHLEAEALLGDLVSIDSPTGGTDEAVGFLEDWCRHRGMATSFEAGALVINPGAGDLMLLGHVDTVPGTLPVTLEAGVLTGRGSVDAKGSLCAALVALSLMPEMHDRASLVAVVDEEGPSHATRHIRDTWEPRPCIVLEPSGWDGITVSYNGRLILEVDVCAPASHSGHDTPFSAEEAFNIWQGLQGQGRARIVSMEGDAGRTRMVVDMRYSGQPPALPENAAANISVLEEIPPYRSNKNTSLVRALLRSIREVGGSPTFKRKSGTADMNILGEAWTVPIVAYGPGDGILDHTDEERIDVGDYLRSIEVLKLAFKDILRS